MFVELHFLSFFVCSFLFVLDLVSFKKNDFLLFEHGIYSMNEFRIHAGCHSLHCRWLHLFVSFFPVLIEEKKIKIILLNGIKEETNKARNSMRLHELRQTK